MNTNHGLYFDHDSGIRILPFFYEGEEVEEPEVEKEPESPNKESKEKDKVLTQDYVNHLLKEERLREQEKARKANEKTIKELQDLKRTAQLTEEEKQKLEERIEVIRNEFLSKEQIAEKERKKQQEAVKREQEELKKDRDRWRVLYEQSTVDRELIDAAIKGEAYNPEQVLQILKPNTRLVEELDQEDKPTGRFVPKVRLAGKDKDNKIVVFDLSATDAVKQMKEMPEVHGNLFKSGAHGGLGGINNPSYSRGSDDPPIHDPAAFRAWREQRKKNPVRR